MICWYVGHYVYYLKTKIKNYKGFIGLYNMSFEDLFKPYSPEIKGDLETYLRKHDGTMADNFFHGLQYFFIIKDMC